MDSLFIAKNVLEPSDLKVLDEAYKAALAVVPRKDRNTREKLAFELLQSYRSGARDKERLLREAIRRCGFTARHE